MQYLPSSNLYGFSQHPLVDEGEDIDLTIHNIQQYVDLHLDFMLSSGIEKQIDALRGNFYISYVHRKSSSEDIFLNTKRKLLTKTSKIKQFRPF